MKASSFDYRNFTDQLTPAKGKDRYDCPVCGGNNFQVDSATGKAKCWSGCELADIRDAIAPLPPKTIQLKQERSWDYYDRDGVEVRRTVRKDDGRGGKQIYQQFWHRGDWQSKGVPDEVKAKLKATALPYRYSEAIKHDLIFWVEGEQCADRLWALGLAAVTTIGGCAAFGEGKYGGLFEGKNLVICPDQDAPGIKYSEAVAALYPAAKWLYALPNDYRWGKLPAKGGLDIADWLDSGATKEDILESIVVKRQPEASQPLEALDPDRRPSRLAQNILKFGQVFGDRLRFNQLTGSVELDGKSITIEDLEIRLALDFDLDAPRNFQTVVKAIAKPYHPVKEYLESCYARYGEDSIGMLDGLALRYFGNDRDICQLYLRKWLIGAVRRVFEPGTKLDNVLILHGKQGINKSSFFRVIANGWFDDSIGSASDKDERLKLHRNWIHEWGELEAVFRRKDISAVKSFLTTQVDYLRPPYGRETVAMPRFSSIVASTNQDEFLADSTGNRRFWVVPVKQRIDLDLLEQERDQLWAAAVALHYRGEPHWLEADFELEAAAATASFETSDPWESSIADYLENKSRVAVGDLFNLLQIELKDQDRQKQMRLSDILKRSGWIKTERREARNGRRVRVWERPTQAEAAEPEPEPITEQTEPAAELVSPDKAALNQLCPSHLKSGQLVIYRGNQYPTLNHGLRLTLHSQDPKSRYWSATLPNGNFSPWVPAVDFVPIEEGC